MREDDNRSILVCIQRGENIKNSRCSLLGFDSASGYVSLTGRLGDALVSPSPKPLSHYPDNDYLTNDLLQSS